VHLELVRDSARSMPSIANPASVTSARIWHCKYATLAPLAALTGLVTLRIAAFPDEDLSVLTSLTRLRYLDIVHLPSVTNLSALSELSALETLSLATLPSWDSSGKVTVVDSLDPLCEMPSLRHLALFGVVTPDRSLEPLARCTQLQSARFSKYPKAEVARFYESTHASDEHVPAPPSPSG
jgi:hypothetical protein